MHAEYEDRTTIPESRKYTARILGVDNANPTNQLGLGMVLTRTGEGAYRITWANNPGQFVGWRYGFGAAVPADLKGYTAVRAVYDAANRQLDFVVYNSLFAAADLIANQFMDLEIEFSEAAKIR